MSRIHEFFSTFPRDTGRASHLARTMRKQDLIDAYINAARLHGKSVLGSRSELMHVLRETPFPRVGSQTERILGWERDVMRRCLKPEWLEKHVLTDTGVEPFSPAALKSIRECEVLGYDPAG